MKSEELKNIVLAEYKKGNVVFTSFEGLNTISIDDILNQPIEGLLYDLNRDEATILTFINEPKWVNDYALSRIVIELKDRLDKANEELDKANDELKQLKQK